MNILRLPLLDPVTDPGDIPPLVTDPDRLAAVARDAAAMRDIGASALLEPRDEAQLCAWLRAHPSEPVLAQGGLTSLTGGATPSGDIVVSLSRMKNLVVDAPRRRAVAGPGVLLADLHTALRPLGLFYPPAPTHDGASIGGNVATNAAGAATFKYGTTRDWVHRIRVALRHGEVLDITRGQYTLKPGNVFELIGRNTFTCQVPDQLSSSLKKTSAGYYTQDPTDLIDLFIGSEGTLGIITLVEIGLIPMQGLLTALVFLPDAARAVALTETLRERSLARQAGTRPGGVNIRSIEFFDHGCLRLLAREGRLDDLRVRLPDDAGACLLLEMELPAAMGDEDVLSALADKSDGPVADLLDALTRHDVADTTELALPGQDGRRRELAAVREAIPLAVSEWLVQHQRDDPAIHKLGGDMIVPFARLGEALAAYYRVFQSHGLEVVVYGHISDGNVHPNGLPVTGADMQPGKNALLELARMVQQMGGCPLSEHGVGRSALKQVMMRAYRGSLAVAQMRALKAAMDPGWTLARGVLFPAPMLFTGAN